MGQTQARSINRTQACKFYFYLQFWDSDRLVAFKIQNRFLGIPGWRSGLAPAFGPGRTLANVSADSVYSNSILGLEST